MGLEILSTLVISEVCMVSTLYNLAGPKRYREGREVWAVVVKYEGETIYTSSRGEHISNAASITILPKGSSYHWQCTTAGHFMMMEFDSAATYDAPITFHLKKSEPILRLLREMEYKRNMRSITPYDRLESIRDAYTVILSIIQSDHSRYLPREKQERIAPAIEYISKNYTRHITNAELAELCGMSEVYFRKLFTELMDTSPIAYLHEVRIEKAKEMLSSDYGTVGDVALSLGYQSIYDFSRDFKRHTGISPSRYNG